jgi:hypothetical protein
VYATLALSIEIQSKVENSMNIQPKSLLLTAALILSPTFALANSTDTEEPDVIMMDSASLNKSKAEINDYATIKLTNEKRSIIDMSSPQVSVIDSEKNKVLKFEMDYPVAYIRLPEGHYKMIINDRNQHDEINVTSSYDRLASYQF